MRSIECVFRARHAACVISNHYHSRAR